MTFEIDKQNALTKKDKSTKASIDIHITELCDVINTSNEYYTTSSCAGRITISLNPSLGNKKEHRWLFVSHEQITFEQMNQILQTMSQADALQGQLWLKQEQFIIHIGCKHVENAHQLLKLANTVGLTHSGIISLSPKIIVEIIHEPPLQNLIGIDGQIIVNEMYIKNIITIANEQLAKTHEKIEAFKNQFVQKIMKK